jgi:hypothetical protein
MSPLSEALAAFIGPTVYDSDVPTPILNSPTLNRSRGMRGICAPLAIMIGAVGHHDLGVAIRLR